MEIKINQDIRKYKTKDIGNFSFKEAGYIALGTALAFVTYKFTNSFEIALIPFFIVAVIGFFKPFGMSFIQFLRTVVKEGMSPREYINETDFKYDPEEIKELYGDEYDIPDALYVIQTEEHQKYIPKKTEKDRLLG